MLPVPKTYAKFVSVLSHDNNGQSSITCTRNFTTVLSLPDGELFTCPPVTPFAPVPILNFTILVAEIYSP